MVYGQSGTGKSTSLRNFKPEDVCIVNVKAKDLPFKTKHKTYCTNNYAAIDNAIKNAPAKSIVIDDATYLMTDEYMRTAKTPGYQKFLDMALNFYSLVNSAKSLPDEKIVYFIGLNEVDQNGNEKFKTIGKMLDEKVTLEGLFTIVLKTVVTDGHYQFSTQNNGQDTVKAPIGMFDAPLIDNDLAMVDRAIRNYYEL
jgi:hypothetical protein